MIAALVTNRAPVRDYLEVVGRAQPLTETPLPFAIPTTAETGADVTRNAVLLAEDEWVKVGLLSPLMLPAVVRCADAVSRAVRVAEVESRTLLPVSSTH